MKKSMIVMVVIGVVIAGSMSVYAYGGRWNNNPNWQGKPMGQPMMQQAAAVDDARLVALEHH